jgi:RNA polymerase sigma-70 factor (ECF subfamily)
MTVDALALDAVVRAYHARVRQFGRRACRSADDADDAVQEAFEKLARRPDVVRHPGALSWLMTVVRNACARLLRPFARTRRALGEPVEDVEDVEAPVVSPAAALARLELLRAVHDAIAALPEPSRTVLVLRDLEGLSGEATCRALGIEVAAMKSRLHRARAELRAALVERRVLE